MPLKHTTETFLLAVLAVLIAVTGIVIPTLPHLPEGTVPWAICFVVAILYPVALSSLFRTNRADNAFRLLHWVPALMLLLWLALEGLVKVLPQATQVLAWYTWGWGLPAVAAGFILLALYSLQVLRRWVPRLWILALLFVPFIVAAIAAEQKSWDNQVASVLWQGDWWKLEVGTGTVAQVAQQTSTVSSAEGDSSEMMSEKNLEPSSDPKEESYRERLRAIEQRRERINERLQQRTEESSESSTDMMAMEGSSSSTSAAVAMIGESSSRPASLPSSGFGWGAIGVALLAAYCTVLHRRQRS